MEFYAGQKVKQVIAELQKYDVKININEKLTERWFFLKGDCDALEYGATYIKFSRDGESFYVEDFSGRDWDGYTEKELYSITEYVGDVSEVIERATEVVTCGYPLDTEVEDICGDYDSFLLILIEMYVAYGYGQAGDRTGTNGRELLGHSFDVRCVPGNMIEISDDGVVYDIDDPRFADMPLVRVP